VSKIRGAEKHRGYVPALIIALAWFHCSGRDPHKCWNMLCRNTTVSFSLRA